MFIFRAEIKMLTVWFKKKMCVLQHLKVPSSSPRTNGWHQGGNVHHFHANCGLHQQLSLKHSHKSNAAKIHHTQLTHSYRAATNNRTTVNHKAELWSSHHPKQQRGGICCCDSQRRQQPLCCDLFSITNPDYEATEHQRGPTLCMGLACVCYSSPVL